MSADVSPQQAKEFYEDFSLAVGQRDWLVPNLRHEQLKLLIEGLLGDRRGLRIADVGCGAGVITDHLARYGHVDAVDFSSSAIAVAERCSPAPNYMVGGLERLDGPYDLITLFDVLEHIPAGERHGFVAELRSLLTDDGLLFCSTPYPTMTARRRSLGDPTLQIIDEEVDLADVIAEGNAAGLQLMRYEAYDVFGGSPEYQAFVLSPTRRVGGGPALMPAPLRRRSRRVWRRGYLWARRLRYALRAVARGDLRTAGWFVAGRPPAVRS